MSTERLRHRFAGAALLAAGVLSFTAIFYAHLGGVEETRYVNRDDAVITLSHARNLVEYGFVGVSPSGERVEGFSAPLQFFLAAALFSVAPFEYATFFRWQTLLGTMALGAVFALLLVPGSGDRPAFRLALAAIAVIAGAQILASSTAFLWWHASGMENVYKSVGLLALVWALDRMLATGRIFWLATALVSLTAIARIDAIVPVGILLAAFTILWLAQRRDLRALLFTIAALIPWIAFMIVRRLYFGQWEPNTAAAQSIAVADRLADAANAPFASFLDYRIWFGGVGRSLFAFQLLWLLPLAWFLRRHVVAMNRIVLLTAATLACVVQFAMFGPARMDEPRTVTELALYATIAAPFVLLGTTRFSWAHLATGLVALTSACVYTLNAKPHRQDVGWGTLTFERTADYIDRMAALQDLPRPAIASPDLGAVSWRKHFNVIDFGRLGSAIIPKVPYPGTYVAAVAMPDIIELHAPWSCFYRELFHTPAFQEQYVRVTAPDPRDVQCPGPTGPHQAFWIRRAIVKDSGSPERAFLDRFRGALTTDVIERELTRCLAAQGPRPCDYVGRTLFRFAPELRRAGRGAEVAALLARDSRLRVEYAFFTSSSNPHWWSEVVSATPQLVAAHVASGGQP